MGFFWTFFQIWKRPRRTLALCAAVLLLMLGFPCCMVAQSVGVQPNTSPAPGSQPQQTQQNPNGSGVQNAAPGSKLPNDYGAQQLSAQRPPGVSEASGNAATTPGLDAWKGLTVRSIEFKGVGTDRLDPLPAQLAAQPNQPLDPEKIRQSLRRLYATGLYKTIEVEGVRNGNDIAIIFSGEPAFFVGRVTVEGVKSDRLGNQLQRSTRLNAGTPYNVTRAAHADDLLNRTLEENGFYEGKVFTSTSVDNANSLVNLRYVVEQGKQARVGDVDVDGDSGISLKAFRKKGKLKLNSKVTRDTVNRALSGLRKNYQQNQRLEANVRLESKTYQPPVNHLNYKFNATQGPLVRVRVEGTSLSKGKVKRLVPVYEEGAVDEDLLNEGGHRIRDYYQRQGYFDAKVTHTMQVVSPKSSIITYDVKLGPKHEVDAVAVTGNKYFTTDLIMPRLSVRKNSIFDHHGTFSAAYLDADEDAITALYQSNGFSHVKVTPIVHDTDDTPNGSTLKLAHVTVKYVIDEGVQQRIGKYVIQGNKQISLANLTPLLNTQSGQPYSSLNVTGDRDAILTYYLSHGFDHAQVNIVQRGEKENSNLIDITMNITEGDQIFVHNVLISGLHYTRPSTVKDHIFIHPGDPLNETAILNTQRQLYDLTLFNEVNAAVQNPGGNQLRKNVLLQFTEARRWDITYGAGFQAQTGNPSTNCNAISLIQLGLSTSTNCGPNGKFGVSPLVSLDISRINLRGRDQSISLKTTYGTLETNATLIFSDPHFFGNPNFNFSLSGGYTNAQDITTYSAAIAQAVARITQRVTKPTTLIYDFQYRRVSVNANSIQVAPDEIPLLAEPVRVGGPSFTWIRDTRSPTPLDAHAGTYNTVQDFIADSKFGSEDNFNRFDSTNNTYYELGSRQWVIARSTRIAFERTFGPASEQLIPLPERLYAGGAQSLRGFGINSAGPRDSITGFPIGGAGAFVNSTELRLPYPQLPYFGNNLGFVLFEDMGNVFTSGSDIWSSALRIKQPHSYTCKDLNEADQNATTHSNSIEQKGTCSFNDFSHAVGLGLRYHTPIGPVRLDFSYNLNPPIYPIILDYSNPTPAGQPGPPRVGQAPHFNFFFSIGQAF